MYSKEPSDLDGSFENPKHMFKPIDKKIMTFILKKFAYLVLWFIVKLICLVTEEHIVASSFFMVFFQYKMRYLVVSKKKNP